MDPCPRRRSNPAARVPVLRHLDLPPPHVFVFLSSSPTVLPPRSLSSQTARHRWRRPADRCFPPYLYPRARKTAIRIRTSNSCSRFAWRRHGFPVESRPDARAASPLLPVRRDDAFRVGQDVHHHQQVRDDGVARGDARRQLQRGRVRAQDGAVGRLHGAAGVVGPHLGPHGLRLRPGRHRQVRHGLLRRVPQVRRVGRPAGEPGRVHARLPGLLRREPGGRLQPAHHGDTRERARQLLGGRVRRRPPGHLPPRALREGPQREDGGVPERLRRVQHRPVLLPRQVRGAVHLPAHALLQEVQGGLPVGIQLRLRRPQQPLPVLRRRLRRHLLRKQEAVGVHAPQQQSRVQWLKPIPAGHDAAGAARQLRGTAVCHVIQENRI